MTATSQPLFALWTSFLEADGARITQKQSEPLLSHGSLCKNFGWIGQIELKLL
jgi:hypothetical protein